MHIIRKRYQQGAALLVALIMLLLITMIGVSSMQTTTLEEKMAANYRDYDIALQMAEMGMVAAEQYIENDVSVVGHFTSDCNNGLCSARDYDDDYDRWNDPAYCSGDIFSAGCSKSAEVDGKTRNAAVAENPRCIIEKLTDLATEEDTLNQDNDSYGDKLSITVFRVTAYGTGGSPDTHVMLQTTYGKQI